jgi:hypothetical protein
VGPLTHQVGDPSNSPRGQRRPRGFCIWRRFTARAGLWMSAENLERAMGFEPMTPTLARLKSPFPRISSTFLERAKPLHSKASERPCFLALS